MKIAVISDIHDNFPNLRECLEQCAKERIEVLACCGDVTNADTLEYLGRNFSGPIHLVRGNSDIYKETEPKRYQNIIDYGRAALFSLAGKTIGLCHEPFLESYVLKQGACNIVFYGHTHKPWIDKRANHIFVNPGTLGGVFQSATYAVWETSNKEPELKVLY